MSGIHALAERFHQCRAGFTFHTRHTDGELVAVMADGAEVTAADISEAYRPNFTLK